MSSIDLAALEFLGCVLVMQFNAIYSRYPNHSIIKRLLDYEQLSKLQSWSERLVCKFNRINEHDVQEVSNVALSNARINSNIRELAKETNVENSCLSALVQEFQMFREDFNVRFDKLEQTINKRSISNSSGLTLKISSPNKRQRISKQSFVVTNKRICNK
jgi:hypothetical protein